MDTSNNRVFARFLLPFRVPIEDERGLIYGKNYGEYKLFFHTLIEEGLPYKYNINCYRSSISAELMYKDGLPEIGDMELIRLFIYDVVELINTTIHSIKIETGVQQIYEITIRDLPSIIEINLRGTERNYFINSYLFYKETNYNYIEEIKKIAVHQNETFTNPNYYLENKFHGIAKRYYIQESFSELIINLETAFEIFIYATVEKYLKSIGVSQEKITDIKKCGLKNLIKDKLAGWLGIGMEYENEFNEDNTINTKYNSNIALWYNDLYIKRNNIVHNGQYGLNGEEAIKAIAGYENTRDYIISLFKRIGFEDFNDIVKTDLNQQTEETTANLQKDIEEYIKTIKKLNKKSKCITKYFRKRKKANF